MIDTRSSGFLLPRFRARYALAACLAAAAVSAQSVPPTRQVPPAPPHAPEGISYADITERAGLSAFRHVSGGAAKRYIIEVVGSGVAMWDFDADGDPDIYLVNGSTLDRRQADAPAAALFRNNGDLTFTDVTVASGVANHRWGQGVCAGDFDNDGREDLYVTNFGPNRLYRAGASHRFEDVAERAGVAVDSWSTGCAFGDYDNDGWLDLFVAGYVSFDPAHPPPAPDADVKSTAAATDGQSSGQDASAQGMGAAFRPGAGACRYRGERVMCGPRGLPGARDHLFHNNRDGTFTDVSEQAGVADAEALYGFGVAWVDLDDDGWQDLVVANDSGPNYVYRNLGTGRFEDISYESGAALDGNGREQAHMGIAVGDYDNDGRADIHITNFADDFNVLYHNDGGFFSDVSFKAGLRVTMPFLGWGTDFLDYDNDGWLDLLVVNGHVYPKADELEWNTSYAQRALLFRNVGDGKFEDVGAAAGPALNAPRIARGSAVGDIDGDGGVDIVVNNLGGRPTLARNRSGSGRGHWIGVQLIGDPARHCPRDAIGSVVFVTAGGVRRRAEVASGRGQISQSDLRVHVGLGRASSVERLDVRWAGGQTATYAVGRVDTTVVIDQRTGSVTYRP